MAAFLPVYLAAAQVPGPKGWAMLMGPLRAATEYQSIRLLGAVYSWAHRSPKKAAAHPHHDAFVRHLVQTLVEDRVFEFVSETCHIRLAVDFPWTDEFRNEIERTLVREHALTHPGLVQALLAERPMAVLPWALQGTWGDGAAAPPSYLACLATCLADPEREAFDHAWAYLLGEVQDDQRTALSAHASASHPQWVAQALEEWIVEWFSSLGAGLLRTGPSVALDAWVAELQKQPACPADRLEQVLRELREEGNPNRTAQERDVWERHAVATLLEQPWSPDWQVTWQMAWPSYRAAKRREGLSQRPASENARARRRS